VKRLLLGLLAFYKRRISPLLPPACRFAPTCSEYARLALIRDGVVRGGAKALGRILRCQPFALGGIDLP
jgi:putative membrane protein insertion efficiency factor